MAFATGFAIYFIMWWITLFAVLPWGVRSQVEAGDVVPGSAPSAPAQPMLLKKALWTTAVSGVLFAIGYAVHSAGVTMEDILFLDGRIGTS
jgi:predicted secreted protein